ncbi:MAG: hypothetical protein Kow0076_1300 [Francisella sp.]
MKNKLLSKLLLTIVIIFFFGLKAIANTKNANTKYNLNSKTNNYINNLNTFESNDDEYEKIIAKAEEILKDSLPSDNNTLTQSIENNIRLENSQNYKDLLNDIANTDTIDETFKQIDYDEETQSPYHLPDGYPIQKVTTVALLSKKQKNLEKCLKMQVYGIGTWRTYCQPLKKPPQCSDNDWQKLTTMPIMYCQNSKKTSS